jgi:hypothetical protein
MTPRPVAWNQLDQGAESQPQAFAEPHHPIAYWAGIWSFSPKTIREWFRDEFGPGILRQPNVGRRSKRDYTTIMISPSAAARVYAKRIGSDRSHRGTREVM